MSEKYYSSNIVCLRPFWSDHHQSLQRRQQTHERAKVSGAVTSQARRFPDIHGTKVQPIRPFTICTYYYYYYYYCYYYYYYLPRRPKTFLDIVANSFVPLHFVFVGFFYRKGTNNHIGSEQSQTYSSQST